jgi:hypothetical protein
MDIPKQQISYLVGKLHVGESDDKVRALIQSRTKGHPNWTPALVRKAQAYGVKVHRDNQRLYAMVMGGNFARKRRANPDHVYTIATRRDGGGVYIAQGVWSSPDAIVGVMGRAWVRVPAKDWPQIGTGVPSWPGEYDIYKRSDIPAHLADAADAAYARVSARKSNPSRRKTRKPTKATVATLKWLSHQYASAFPGKRSRSRRTHGR